MPRLSPLALALAACIADDAAVDTSAATAELELAAADDPAAAVADDPAAAADDLAGGACPVTGTRPERSLAVTDPVALERFAFRRVMTRLRQTAGVAAQQSNLELFQRWMRTFDVGLEGSGGGCDDPGIDPEGYGIVCPRAPEAKLAGVNPFAATARVQFLPVGLFNRFDLAPSTGAHCGEYRIVYAMQSTHPNVPGRGFLIFEGVLPNPRPADGVGGCLPVARFLQRLTTDADPTSRADKLERFYLTGGAIPGFRAVVHAQSYGLAVDGAAHGAGQIRTNMFVDFLEWQLREFKLRKTCSGTDPATCRLAFAHVTVKTNPAEELFAGTHPRSPELRASFLAQVTTLARPNLNLLGMATPDALGEHESVSQTANVDYDQHASPSLRAAIDARLDQMGSNLSASDILRRATTQTCGGCHQVSSGVPLGGNRAWPLSLGFVHVDETGALSPAIVDVFLPHRRAVLEHFINARCTTAAAPPPLDPTRTVGGSAIGAAN